MAVIQTSGFLFDLAVDDDTECVDDEACVVMLATFERS